MKKNIIKLLALSALSAFMFASCMQDADIGSSQVDQDSITDDSPGTTQAPYYDGSDVKSFTKVTLESGSTVVLYNADSKTLLTSTASGSKLSGAEATIDSDSCTISAESACVLTVNLSSDGYYSFTDSSGEYLTSKSTGNGLSFASDATDYSLWTLEEVSGGYYIKNKSAVSSSKEQYLEYYKGYTTYGFSTGSEAQYTFSFYMSADYTDTYVEPEPYVHTTTFDKGYLTDTDYDSAFSADTSHTDNSALMLGNPSKATGNASYQNNYLMHKETADYYICYNNTTHNPNWVAWHLQDTDTGSTERSDKSRVGFHADTDLPDGWYQVTTDDYTGSGFTRGHMCPSSDRTASDESNDELFLMTNMVPQTANNNNTVWNGLEQQEIDWLSDGKELYIICGPYGIGGTYAGDASNTTTAFSTTYYDKTTPVEYISVTNANDADDKGILVPSSTWRVVLVLDKDDGDYERITKDTTVIAINVPNTYECLYDSSGNKKTWKDYITTVDAIEELTGFDFWSELEDSVEDVLEAKVYGTEDYSGSYGKIVKTESLSDGVYLIGSLYNSSYQIFNTTGTSKTYGNITATAFTATDNVISVTQSGNYYKLSYDSTEDAYTIMDAATGNYIYQKGTYDNFNYSSAPTEGQYWTFTVNADGTWTILNKNVNKFIQYIPGSSYYGSYDSLQTDAVYPCLFKKDAEAEEVTAPVSCSNVTFSIESNTELDYGSTITLSSQTDGAVIYYSTALFTKDEYTSGSVTLTSGSSVRALKSGTLYAIADSSGTASEVTSITYTVKALTLPDSACIYYADSTDSTSVLLGTESSSNKLSGVSVTVSSDSYSVTDNSYAVFTVEQNEDGYYTFVTSDSKYLYTTSGNVLSLAESTTAKETTSYLWIPLSTTDGYYLVNAYSGKYLEYYSGFTVYNYKDTNDSKHIVSFVQSSKVSVPDTYVAPVTFSPESSGYTENMYVVLSCATSGASIYYSTTESLTKDNYKSSGTLYVAGETGIQLTEACTVYAIAVKDENVSDASSAEYSAVSSNSEEFSLSSLLGSSTISYSDGDVINLTDDLTLTLSKNTGSSMTAYNKAGELRVYTNNMITLAHSSKNITQIVFTCSGSGYIGELSVDSGTVTSEDAVDTWTSSDSSGVSSVAVTNTGKSQFRITQIKVYYAE